MKDFKWGVATAAYQIEGHFNAFKTIWDTFAETDGNVFENHNGEVACNHLDLFKEDVQLIKDLGVDVYRFSISWARIFPEKGKVSQKGLAFYRALLQELKNNQIEANVTMYHWDMPDWVYQENGGWTSQDTVEYFLEYTSLIINEFDDLVDEWTTLNEPFCSTYLGYANGIHAPGHSSIEEFYKSVHYILLSHAKTLEYYRTKFTKPIGIVLNMTHMLPATESKEDEDTTSLYDAMHHKMYLEPLFKGKYPETMYNISKDNNIDLSFIKKEDLSLISMPMDFMGINYYTHTIIEKGTAKPFGVGEAKTDLPKTAMGWDVTAYALKEIIQRVRDEYTSIPIYITENGAAFDDEINNGQVKDFDRVDYLKQHIDVIEEIKDTHNVKGYFVWSLMDNFEWAFGYSKRFGIVYIDFKTMKRTPKESYYYFKKRIKNV